jgi:phospholipase C
MITRRQAITRIGGGTAAALIAPRLFGCGDSGGGPGDNPSGITHLIEVCMENRSFDHWFGAKALLGRPGGGDGLTAAMANKRLDGTEVKVYPAGASGLCVQDPPHGRTSALAQMNGGKMDGFLTEHELDHGPGADPVVLSYMLEEHIPFSWKLAERFTICDRWFSAMAGPTWPNRLYLHSAQCGGLTSNMLPASGAFDWATIYNRLNDKGVGWTYYWSDLPVAGLWKDLPTAYNVRRIAEFFADCEAGTLPQVSVVEPAFGANDDHPPHHPMLGQQFLSAVFHAVARSPHWNNCLIVITYDEQGGFFDHVPPPVFPDLHADQGLGQAGFRVPTIIAGPYVKQGFVDSTVREHSSLVRHIRSMFGIDPLTPRDEAAADLSAALDLERLAANDPLPPPDDLPEVVVDESMIDDACYKRSPRYARYAKNDLEHLADTGYFGALDLRAELPDTLRLVAGQLEKYGKGGFRKGR